MKKQFLLALIFPWYLSLAQPSSKVFEPDTNRIAVHRQGKIGFIDTSGKLIIPTQFESSRAFSEGLCAVRVNGRYGFINGLGKMTIPPMFDYATEFHEGIASVFMKGEQQFIDRRGRRMIFHKRYKKIFAFKDGLAHSITYSEKVGVINKQGDLVIDTAYSKIGRFTHGAAVAHSLMAREDSAKSPLVSLINTAGEQLIPFGKFTEIENLNEGFFAFTTPDDRRGFIDARGQILYVLEKGFYPVAKVSEGITIISTSRWRGEQSNTYITPYGKMVYTNRDTRYFDDFHENHAVILNSDKACLSIINKNGHIIVKEGIKNFRGKFENGLMMVYTDDGWGVIDTTGNFILAPTFKELGDGGLFGKLVIFSKENLASPLHGIADLNGNILVQPSFPHFYNNIGANGLLEMSIGTVNSYFNQKGKMIWQANWRSSALAPLNVDFMVNSYFAVGSDDKREYPIQQKLLGKSNVLPNALSIVVRPKETREFSAAKSKGMAVDIINTTNDTLCFMVQNRKL